MPVKQMLITTQLPGAFVTIHTAVIDSLCNRPASAIVLHWISSP